jgi:integrase
MTAGTNKMDGFALVKRARALIEGVNTSASDSTIQQYCAAFVRMKSRDLTPETIANTSRSFYYYRAAWVNYFSTAIRAALNAADKAQRQKDTASWQIEIERLPNLIKELERYRPDPERENLSKGWVGDWAVEAEKRGRAGIKITSHSKRSRLRGLPVNWREQMFSGLKVNSKYRDVVAVLSATGARPAEFSGGITVTLEGVDALRFQIAGAKTSGGKYGQAERAFTVKVDRPELQHLHSRVQESAGTLIVKAAAGALSDKIRQLSMKVFPLLKSEVSAYVFRHQMAADLKASGIADVDVSAALGHSVDETKGAYGAAQSARSVGGISNVEASRPVRQKTREKLMQLELRRTRAFER